METHRQRKKTHKEFYSRFTLGVFGLGGKQRTVVRDQDISTQFVQREDLWQREGDAIKWRGLFRRFHYL